MCLLKRCIVPLVLFLLTFSTLCAEEPEQAPLWIDPGLPLHIVIDLNGPISISEPSVYSYVEICLERVFEKKAEQPQAINTHRWPHKFDEEEEDSSKVHALYLTIIEWRLNAIRSIEVRFSAELEVDGKREKLGTFHGNEPMPLLQDSHFYNKAHTDAFEEAARKLHKVLQARILSNSEATKIAQN